MLRTFYLTILYSFMVLGLLGGWERRLNAEPSDYKKFEYISIEQGLSQSFVLCMIQDRQGFLWFGTEDGLNRYDGYEFKHFFHDPNDPDSLSHNTVKCLLEDSAGNIWVGTSDGGLNRFDPKRGTFVYYKSDPGTQGSLGGNNVSVLHQDIKGNLWVGTGRYLNRFYPETGTFKTYEFIAPKEETPKMSVVFAINSDRSGRILVGGYHLGMAIFDPETETFLYFNENGDSPGGVPSNNVQFIIPGDYQTFWIGTQGAGLLSFDLKTKRFSGGFTDTFRGFPLKVSYIFGGFQSRLRPNILWLTTLNGLVEFDTKKRGVRDYIRSGEGSNLIMNDIVDVLEDSEGNIWIATFGKGLNKYVKRKSLFKEWRREQQVAQNSTCSLIPAVVEDRRGKLFAGTLGGGIECYDRETGDIQFFRDKTGDDYSRWKNFVKCMTLDRAGNIWFGTHGGGLNRLDQTSGRFHSFVNKPGDSSSLPCNVIISLLEDGGGAFWIGTRSAGLVKMDRETGTFKRYPILKGDSNDDSPKKISVLFEDRKNQLWIGTDGAGICVLDEERTGQTVFRNNPLDPDSINCDKISAIYQDSAGRVWIGTDGGGLDRFDREANRFDHLTLNDGLPSNVVCGILEDDHSHLWVSTIRGLACFTPSSMKIEVFTTSDGLPTNEFISRSCFKSPSGELHFGTTHGLVSFSPDALDKSGFVPPVVFTSFQLLNRDIRLKKTISYLEELKLSYRDTFLIEFAALSYSSPSKNQYAYKLSGLQDEWVPLGSKRVLNFAHLEPGEYQLRVKGSGSGGLWNEEGASIRLIIQPPIWQTWWFKLLVILIIIAAAYRWHATKLKNATLKLKTESAMNRLFARFKISEREQEIVALVLKGKTNKEIEDELFISIKTVKSHIYNVYRKMGVKSRLELINLIQTSTRE